MHVPFLNSEKKYSTHISTFPLLLMIDFLVETIYLDTYLKSNTLVLVLSSIGNK